MVMPKNNSSARSSINQPRFKLYHAGVDRKLEQEEKEAIAKIKQNQNRKEIKFVCGEEVYIHTYIEGRGTDFYKFIFDKRIGHNLFFKRITPANNIVPKSVKVSDYELGLVKIYTHEERKNLKKQKAIDEIDKWMKMAKAIKEQNYENRKIKIKSGDAVQWTQHQE